MTRETMTDTATRTTRPAPGVTRRVLRQRRRQLWRDRMIPVLLLLLGAVVLVYPVGATFYNLSLIHISEPTRPY